MDKALIVEFVLTYVAGLLTIPAVMIAFILATDDSWDGPAPPRKDITREE